MALITTGKPVQRIIEIGLVPVVLASLVVGAMLFNHVEPARAYAVGSLLPAAPYMKVESYAKQTEEEATVPSRPFYMISLPECAVDNMVDLALCQFTMDNPSFRKVQEFQQKTNVELSNEDITRLNKSNRERQKENLTLYALEAASVSFRSSVAPTVQFTYDHYADNQALKAGDVILSVNGTPVRNVDKYAALRGKLPVDYVSRMRLHIKRGNSAEDVTVSYLHKDRFGNFTTGAHIDDVRTFDGINPDEIIAVGDLVTDNSFGLIGRLQIYQDLIREDLTRGRKITGAGAVDARGAVYEINNVAMLVRTAANNGADLFFVTRGTGSAESNEAKAKRTAAEIGTPMRIVPVSTTEEAVSYLKKSE